MHKPNSPCKKDGVDCTERVLGCRTDCLPWQEYEKAQAEWRKAINDIADKERVVRDYKYKGIYKRVRLDNQAKRK